MQLFIFELVLNFSLLKNLTEVDTVKVITFLSDYAALNLDTVPTIPPNFLGS